MKTSAVNPPSSAYQHKHHWEKYVGVGSKRWVVVVVLVVVVAVVVVVEWWWW